MSTASFSFTTNLSRQWLIHLFHGALSTCLRERRYRWVATDNVLCLDIVTKKAFIYFIPSITQLHFFFPPQPEEVINPPSCSADAVGTS